MTYLAIANRYLDRLDSSKELKIKEISDRFKNSSINLYTKNWEFDKKTFKMPCSEQVTIAQGQGTSENRNFEVKSTKSKPNFSNTMCIEGVITINTRYVDRLLASKEVVNFTDNTSFKPSAEDVVAAIVAHEVAHWKKRHCHNQLIDLKSLKAKKCADLCIVMTIASIALTVLFKCFLTLAKFSQMPYYVTFASGDLAGLFACVAVVGLLFAMIEWLVSVRHHLIYMHARREREHEADLYAMELLQGIGVRPETELWIGKASYDVFSQWNHTHDPDRSWMNYYRYLRDAKHPTDFERYKKALVHLKKLKIDEKLGSSL